MRLNKSQIDTINKLATEIFGVGTKVSLFGSRTDDSRKGGDIDLFISNKQKLNLSVKSKVKFMAKLKSQIGNRKIDVVFDNAGTHQKKVFYRSICETKIDL